MARVIEEVAVRIGADTRGLKKGMTGLQRQMRAFKRTIVGVGAALGIAFGGRALVQGFRRTIDSTNAIIKTAKGVGFTVNEYERMAFALDQVGVNAESLRIGLGDLQKRLGNKNFAKFYRAIGIDPAKLREKSPATQLMEVLEALRKVPDNKLVTLAGGALEEQSGKDFAKTVRQWEDFTKALKDYDRRISGSAITSRGARDIQEMAYETKLLSQQWENIKRNVVAETLPEFKKLLKELDETGALKKLGEDLVTIAGALAESVRLLAKLRTEANVGNPLDPPELRGLPRGHPKRHEFKRKQEAAANAPNPDNAWVDKWTTKAITGNWPAPTKSGGGTNVVFNQTNSIRAGSNTGGKGAREIAAEIDKRTKETLSRLQRGGVLPP